MGKYSAQLQQLIGGTIESQAAIWVLLAAVLILLLLGLYWRHTARHWKALAERFYASERFYLKQIGSMRDKYYEAHKAMKQAELEKRNAELGLEMAEKNLSVSQEHLKYYIETLADTEKLVRIKDEELEGLDPDEEKQYLTNKIEMLRSLLAKKLIQERDLKNELAALKAKIEELKASYNSLYDFSSTACSKPGPFSQVGDAHDPKRRIEIEDAPLDQ